ncbi:MAG TPA: hypothetical protein PKG95_00745 [Anaerolineaceae bacterium]|jgi:hypothetical protein|nr:hypothetical protein [Anaerolineaceae bacterium]
MDINPSNEKWLHHHSCDVVMMTGMTSIQLTKEDLSDKENLYDGRFSDIHAPSRCGGVSPVDFLQNANKSSLDHSPRTG